MGFVCATWAACVSYVQLFTWGYLINGCSDRWEVCWEARGCGAWRHIPPPNHTHTHTHTEQTYKPGQLRAKQAGQTKRAQAEPKQRGEVLWRDSPPPQILMYFSLLSVPIFSASCWVLEIPDVKMSAFSLVCAAQSNRKNNLINSTAMSLPRNFDTVGQYNPLSLLWAVSWRNRFLSTLNITTQKEEWVGR